jgi:hypothetical protein
LRILAFCRPPSFLQRPVTAGPKSFEASFWLGCCRKPSYLSASAQRHSKSVNCQIQQRLYGPHDRDSSVANPSAVVSGQIRAGVQIIGSYAAHRGELDRYVKPVSMVMVCLPPPKRQPQPQMAACDWQLLSPPGVLTGGCFFDQQKKSRIPRHVTSVTSWSIAEFE